MCSIHYVSGCVASLVAAATLAGCGLDLGQSAPPAEVAPPSTTSTPFPPAAAAPPTVRGSSEGGAKTSRIDDEPHARRSQLSIARGVARAFLDTYVPYLYGRLPAERVADASPALRHQLASGRAEPTPAERSSRPRIARLSVAATGPPVSVTVVAVVRSGLDESWRLTATVEPSGRRWLVVAIGS